MPAGSPADLRRCTAGNRPAPCRRLSDPQLEQVLLEGATANGFTGELWTLERIALVIERLTGVRHHPAHVWALLRHRLGWTVPAPGPPLAVLVPVGHACHARPRLPGRGGHDPTHPPATTVRADPADLQRGPAPVRRAARPARW
jgi:hypothetical protein